MKDYEKLNQAKQLLAESGAKYVFAYETDSESIDNVINGTGEEVLGLIVALVDNLVGNLASDGAPKPFVEMVVIGTIKDAIETAYKENKMSQH